MKILIVLLGLSVQSPIDQANISCGMPPIPPVGCVLGQCLCDGNGHVCHWTFVCG